MTNELERRAFLALTAAGTLSLLTACAGPPVPGVRNLKAAPPILELQPLPVATVEPSVPGLETNFTKFPLPSGPITGLPTSNNLMAWTVDDGWGEDTVYKYAEFARDSGVRITFFICAGAPSWRKAAQILKPLVEAGQVQIANHTFTHSRLTSLSNDQLKQDLQQNHDLIMEIFGVDARPFYRPPYGVRDERTDAAAAEIGYTVPVMWYGSLSDAGEISPDQVLEFANKWFLPEHIVIGHANFPSVTQVFPQLTQLIDERNLITVTLNDVFQV